MMRYCRLTGSAVLSLLVSGPTQAQWTRRNAFMDSYERLAAVRFYDDRCHVLPEEVRVEVDRVLSPYRAGDRLISGMNQRAADAARNVECGSPAGEALVRNGLAGAKGDSNP